MSTSITVSEARSSLPKILERVEAGEEVSLTRHGEVVAVIVRPDCLRSRRSDAASALAAEARAAIRAGRDADLDELPGLTNDRAEEIVAQIRADRSRR